MSQKRVKIVGAIGDWTALVEGRRLAVLHSTWWKPPHEYRDPMVGVRPEGKRFTAYFTALQENDIAVMQRDKPGELRRDGYVGVFHFKDPIVNDDGSVSLHIISRYANPS